MGHWYSKDGVLFNTTLRTARKDKLFASVTEQQKIEGAPGLEQWKQNELLKLSYEFPAIAQEDCPSFIRRLRGQDWDRAKGTMELGTRIHDALQTCLEKDVGPEAVDSDLAPYVIPALEYFKEKEFEIEHLEHCVVNLGEAYAGMADCIAKTPCGKKFILDWKSKKTKPGEKVKPYHNQIEQVSAYAGAYWGVEALENLEVYGVNAFISTTEVNHGRARFEKAVYSPEEMWNAYKNFCVVAKLWRIRNKYDPRESN